MRAIGPIAALVCAATLAGPAAPARAQQPPAGETPVEQAKRLYKSATVHYNLAEFREALEQYKEAYRVKPDPVFLFNIGQCYRQMGDMVGAARSYRSYLRENPSAPNRAEVEKLIASADAAAAAREQSPIEPQPPRGTGATSAGTSTGTAAPSTASGTSGTSPIESSPPGPSAPASGGSEPMPGQPMQPMPGQPMQPMPGQPMQPMPGQPMQPMPGQPMQPMPMWQPQYAAPRVVGYEQKRNLGLAIAGFSILGGMWLTNALIGTALVGENWFAVPVIGPFGYMASNWDNLSNDGYTFYTIDGLVQVAGLAMGIAGLLTTHKEPIYSNRPRVTLLPRVSTGGVGLIAAGTF